jgi:cell division protein FtsW
VDYPALAKAIPMLKLEKNLLIIVTIVLCFLGILFVFESSALESFERDGTAFNLAGKQLIGFLLGILALIIAARFPLKFYLKSAYIFYFIALVLIGLCFWDGIPPALVGNVPVHGARRWIWLFGISVQVAEIVKFCLIVFLAYLFAKTKNYLIFLLYLSPIVLLVGLQKDLGSLLVIFAIGLGLYYLAGASLIKLLPLGLVILASVIILIIIEPFRLDRITSWLNPESDPQGTGLHILQLEIAIGRGELIGKGIGDSRQKYAYVPETSTDSIFAIIAEEIGFVGVSIIISLYLFFLYLIWRIVQFSHLNLSERLIGDGIFILFASQTFINLGGISGLIPFTGITLPFFSAGGSSLAISLFLVGVIISLSKTHSPFKYYQRKYV